MNERVELRVTLELLSDAIFGSGYSIPGGEDIAVVRDDAGYPYIPGTAVKGLLRESMENLAAWADGDDAGIGEILGQSGWEGVADGRRLTLTPLTVEGEYSAAENCFGTRVFTALEDGVVKEGTLRTAACVKRGTRFAGTMVCAREDVDLLTNALAGVKWAGAQRSRGFGRVRFRVEQTEKQVSTVTLGNAGCICYRLYMETPVIITDLSHSGGSRKKDEGTSDSANTTESSTGSGNSYETRGYIPGSAIRGMVVSRLAETNPAWFEEHKIALLSEQTRFLDALPKPSELETLPSVMGFYESKDETQFKSVLTDPDVSGLKRAKPGSFCGLDGDTIRYWSARTGGVTRIQRSLGAGEDTKPFQTRHISPGQVFEGYILLDDETLASQIGEILSGDIWIGADRYEGYGKCAVTGVEAVGRPGWIDAYGYHYQNELGTTLYLLAVSPLTMRSDLGEPCGLNEAALAELLDVGSVTIQFCSTTISEYGSYNRTWQCREPALPMYDRGSIFKLICDQVPLLDRLRAIEIKGLGVRTAEGFGQVLFLRGELFEGLRKKQVLQQEKTQADAGNTSLTRRARYTWIMKHSGELHRGGLSKSQLGAIQALCEKAVVKGGDNAELEEFLNKNLQERGGEAPQPLYRNRQTDLGSDRPAALRYHRRGLRGFHDGPAGASLSALQLQPQGKGGGLK